MSVRSSLTLLASATVLTITTQVGVVVPTAAAEPSWSPEKVVATSSRGSSLIVDAQSNTWVVWEALHGAIKVARRPAGGTWREPMQIARTNSAMAEPQLAADAAGNLTVVWITYRQGFTDGVKARVRNVHGRWSDAVRISQDKRVPGYPADGKGPWGARWLDLAVSPKGAATVAWAWGSEDRGKPWRIQSVFRPAGGSWGHMVQLTRADGAQDPQVGMAADGSATLLYSRQLIGQPQRLFSMTRVPGRGWNHPTTVTARGYLPHLVVDRAGDAMVVFMTLRLRRVMAVYRADGRQWGAPRQVSPEGVRVDTSAAAMNGQGAAVVAWVDGDGRVGVTRRPARGPWSTPRRVVDVPDHVGYVAVALNQAGDTFLAWGLYALYGTYRPGGGSWTSPVTLSPETDVDVLETVDAWVAPNGDPVVMWSQEGMPLKVRVGTAP
jgi:hypothetical protein